MDAISRIIYRDFCLADNSISIILVNVKYN